MSANPGTKKKLSTVDMNSPNNAINTSSLDVTIESGGKDGSVSAILASYGSLSVIHNTLLQKKERWTMILPHQSTPKSATGLPGSGILEKSNLYN